MKRILVAVVIALLFHALLFSLKPDWLNKSRAVNAKPHAITITMSYKKKVIPPPVKKSPEKIEKTIKKETVKPKIVKKKPDPVIIEEKNAEPEPVKEKTEKEKVDISEEAIDDFIPVTEDEIEEASSESEGMVTEIVTEAEPLYKLNPEPKYPRMAKKRGYQGTVLLSVLVNKEGMVENLWVFESCGYNILDNAALEAVKDWIFEPGRQGDKPVEMWVQVPVRFEIK